jgi:mRNA-degrading endonuclease RelE of RelBE toxin-antitoxin system
VSKQPPYRIEWTHEAREQLRAMGVRDRAAVVDTVPPALQYQPTLIARNRKLLKANEVAPWELRVGNWRVFYDVQERPERIVSVRAVGLKRRDRVLIGGEEYEL